MKILVIHQYYLAPGQPGGSRFNELARLWREAGHQVVVIAGTLNYATGETPEDLRGAWIRKRDEDGIEVWRCHVPTTYSRGYAGRMWAFFGFTVSSIVAAFRVARPDVVIATSPPLTTAVTGWIAALRHRAPWVFEIRDLWPESAITTGVLSERGLLTRALFALERFACRRADRINVLTPAFSTDIVKRGLAAPGKILFVPNGADAERFVPGPRHNAVRERFGWGDRFVALYAGAHGRANALMQLVDTAELLRGRTDIVIASVGDGPERAACEAAVRAKQLTNIQFLGAQSKDRMADFVNAADAGLAVLQDNPTFRTVYPNKVFDYMACERPTVLAIDGVARTLVCDDAQAGLFAAPENPRQIADAILRLADNPGEAAQLGRNGRVWVLENATRTALAERYLTALTALRAESATRSSSLYPHGLKRGVDIVVSAAALVLLLPLLTVLAIAVRLFLGGPVLFRQVRPGLNARPFTVLKFRTMTDARDASGRLLPDSERLTAFGRFLRSSSLDELPELLNVLEGEMSLVGPRPLLMQYVGRYTPEQARRHDVRPGITGLAQISGRNALSWESKFALDVEYVERCSLALDLRIIALTVWQVIARRGISQPGHATAEEFMGTPAP